MHFCFRGTVYWGGLLCYPAESSFIFFSGCCAIHMSTPNTQVSEAKEFRKGYCYEYESKKDPKTKTISDVSVWCYRGAPVAPKWKNIDGRKSFT